MHAKHTATSQTHTRAHTIPFGMNLFRQTAISDVGMSLITPLNPTEESAGHCVRLQGTHTYTHIDRHMYAQQTYMHVPSHKPEIMRLNVLHS